MQSNGRQANFKYDRQKDYQRQQEKLKAMGGKSDKGKIVSADLIIENFLKESSKITFEQKHSHNNSELPLWLQCEPFMVPPEYNNMWSAVQATTDLADTQKVSQLLLTSNLHIDMLGFIWNLGNVSIPGQLTKKEFFMVLALVSLAQTGFRFSNLGVLKLVNSPGIPLLNINVLIKPSSSKQTCTTGIPLQHNTPTTLQNTSVKLNMDTKEDNAISYVTSQSNASFIGLDGLFNLSNASKDDRRLEITDKDKKFGLPEMSISPQGNLDFPFIGSKVNQESDDDFSEFQSVSVLTQEIKNVSSDESRDEFTDFQSAVTVADPLDTVIVTQKREIPKIPLPKNLVGKLNNLKSNILKISPESEIKLKGLTSKESLSSLPESKISSTNEVSTSISVLGSNHIEVITSRLASHSLGTQSQQKNYRKHKCISSELKENDSVNEEIVFGVKTSNLDCVIPKCCPKKFNNSTNFILRETPIQNVAEMEAPNSKKEDQNIVPEIPFSWSGENTRKIEIPMLGTFNETVLPTQLKPHISTVDLISVQEDKYSALREIDIDMKQNETNSDIKSDISNDEFGDFHSAETSSHSMPSNIPENFDSKKYSFENEENETWGDWNFNIKTESTTINASNDTQNIIDEINEVLSESGRNSPKLLLWDETKDKSQISFISVEPINTKMNEDLNNDSKDISKFDDFAEFGLGMIDPLQNVACESSICLGSNFWNLSSTSEKPVENTFSCHNSLPSLDLKVPSNEKDQENIWKKCLESCLKIIQKGYDIINNVNETILADVFLFPETSSYFNDLKIAYEITKRINQNYTEIPPAQAELDSLWRKLEKLCLNHKIELKPDKDSVAEGQTLCKICFGYIGNDVISLGKHSYHPSCANLWVNCIEETLPLSS